MNEKLTNKNHERIKRMTFVAIFSALSAVLYVAGPKFNLPIFPGFLDFHFSMLPILIASFMLGPIDGLMVVLIRFLVKIPTSSTSCVGELSDLVIGVVVVLSTSLVDKKVNVKYKNLLLFGVGVISWILGSYISNSFSVPFYLNLYGKNAVLGACSMIPGITEENFMIKYYIFGVTPFNLSLSTVVMFVTILTHKRLKDLYNRL